MASYSVFYINIIFIILGNPTVTTSLHFDRTAWKPVQSFVPKPSQFYSFTDPKNAEQFNVIVPGNLTSLENSGLKSGQKIIIILHAYGENAIHESTATFLKTAYLKQGFQNIILVQWGHHVVFFDNSDVFRKYNYAIFENSPREGRNIADFLAFIINSKLYGGAEEFHLIGISQGANVAGAAGYSLQKNHGIRIGRITGLDPPGVFLQYVDATAKLDNHDATFVDVLHTDVDLYGTPERLGHADFFANGGRRNNQPGCKKGSTYLDLAGIKGSDRREMCGHVSSVFTYRKSLMFNMLACKCEDIKGSIASYCGQPLVSANNCSDWTTFGEHSKLNARGSYYLYV